MNRYFEWFHLPGSLVLTCLLSLTALTLAVIFRTPDRWLRLAAMVLGSMGDIILMGYTPVTGKLPAFFRTFEGGGVMFLLGHAFYLAAFLFLIRGGRCRLINPGFWAAAALCLLTLGSLLVLHISTGHRDHGMMLLYGIYLAFECLVLLLTFSYAFAHGRGAYLLALGAVSFVISDWFIGLERCTRVSTLHTQPLIWWFYPIGQLLMILFR